MEQEEERLPPYLALLPAALPWVHEESSKEIGPGEVVEGILFGGDSS